MFKLAKIFLFEVFVYIYTMKCILIIGITNCSLLLCHDFLTNVFMSVYKMFINKIRVMSRKQ